MEEEEMEKNGLEGIRLIPLCSLAALDDICDYPQSLELHAQLFHVLV